ncbi:hypothetical protein HAX54_024014, partial [Datura stramonium]|nr:hypothetical protein [Datura stramonium]
LMLECNFEEMGTTTIGYSRSESGKTLVRVKNSLETPFASITTSYRHFADRDRLADESPDGNFLPSVTPLSAVVVCISPST